MRIRSPDCRDLQSPNPFGANMMIVEPCSNQPSSWPRVTRVEQGISFGPGQRRCRSTFKKCRRMAAILVAAQADNGAFVAAEKSFDAFQRDGVYVCLLYTSDAADE